MKHIHMLLYIVLAFLVSVVVFLWIIESQIKDIQHQVYIIERNTYQPPQIYTDNTTWHSNIDWELFD